MMRSVAAANAENAISDSISAAERQALLSRPTRKTA